MNTLDKYLLRQFITIFLGGLFLFVFLIELIDLFANLWKYLSFDVPLRDIALASLYYVPKCISYSLPISLLFAASFVLGELYSRNELIVVFSSGIPLVQFARSFIAIGLLMSVFSFWFDDQVVIHTLEQKNDLTRHMLRQERSGAETDIVVKTKGGNLLYVCDLYDKNKEALVNLTIVERDGEGHFLSLVRAKRAVWENDRWKLENVTAYTWQKDMLVYAPDVGSRVYNEKPERFLRNMRNVEELPAVEAKKYIADMREAGLEYDDPLTDYYKRFSFSITPLIVIALSVALGGQFQKNVMLMSLLSSLIAAVLYYVTQMVTVMLAKLGYIPPVIGAWAPTVLFVFLSAFLVRRART